MMEQATCDSRRRAASSTPFSRASSMSSTSSWKGRSRKEASSGSAAEKPVTE